MNEKVFKTLEFDKILNMLEEQASSSLGKELVHELTPCAEYGQISRMQQETSEAVSILLRKGNFSLQGAADLRNILKRVRIGAMLSSAELLQVAHTIKICRQFKNYCSAENKNESYPILQELADGITVLKSLEDEIFRCIISAEEIDDHASSTLFSIRRGIRDLHGKIRDKLNDYIRSSKYDKMLQEAVITMRGDRYCIPVKQEYRHQFKGIIHDQSSSGSTLFIEPMAVVEMNNSLRQLQGKEQEEIERILYTLTVTVEQEADFIETNMNLIRQVDFIFAKGKLSLAMNGVQPIFNENKYIHIKKGRHPLLNADSVVPIDIYLGKEFHTLLITGPNTGGKTVSLKTIGLFTLMGQSGLHIPAFDGSELGIFDEVFADIGDEQSIEQNLSTFSSHMKNIVRILQYVTKDSLVLFDELGAGTDPTEGAALARAILEQLHKWKVRTVATTHYAELKLYALTADEVENASMEFDVETLRPTYRLLIGIPGKSNAFAISKRLGISDEIIEHAKSFIGSDEIRFEDVISSLEQNQKLAEIEQQRAMRYRQEVEELKKKLEEEQHRLELHKEDIIQKARQEARGLLHQAKQEADILIKEIQKSKEIADAAAVRRAEEARTGLKEKLSEVESQMVHSLMPKKTLVKPPTLQIGDEVMILTLNQKGTVLKKADKEGNVLVQAGIMKINVHISNLRKHQEAKQNKVTPTAKVSNTVRSKARDVSAQIDLRGRLVEEALMEVDKYIDDAFLGGLSQITIIHGKGTGALRAAIHNFLKRHKHVKTYRLGVFGEGEAGVTVVELK